MTITEVTQDYREDIHMAVRRRNSYSRPGARKRSSLMPVIIAAIVIALIAAAVVFVICLRGNKADTADTPISTEGAVLVDTLSEGLATATPEPTPEPTPPPEPTPVNYGAVLPQPTEAGYLPIVRSADTEHKVIAITVDDCNQFSNTRQIIDCALENCGKITLFPIGKNVLKEGLQDILIYAYENGIQIENHTHEHLAHYQMTDEELARQYYLQKVAVDYVLGVDYQQNFVRPMGGNGRDDQRLHLYCDLMGVKAIAHWNVSGGIGLSDLGKSLAPGNIYLFHTTDKDLEKLLKFIPYAVEQGYELVTLNELFGLPENEVRPLDVPAEDREIPQLGKFVLNPRTYEDGDYAWVAYLIQMRLIQLDYLGGKADGIYGEGTAKAVAKFQRANDLEVTGKCDPKTQRLLFADYPEVMYMLFGDAAAAPEIEKLEPEATIEPEE